MRLKLKYAEMDALIGALNAGITALQNAPDGADLADEDCLIIAVLEELRLKLEQKFLERKDRYGFTLKPSYAFAIRAVFAGQSRTSFAGNLVGQICDKAHQTYYQLRIDKKKKKN
jgi:hypothetical protein